MKLTRTALIRKQMLEFREEEMVPEGFTHKFDDAIRIMSLNSVWHLLGHYGSKSPSGQLFLRRVSMKPVTLSMLKVIGDLVEFMDGPLRYPIRDRLDLMDLALELVYYHRKNPKRGCL